MPVELTLVETANPDLSITTLEVILVSASTPGPAGVGVPSGGTADQVLAKASGTDYDTEWVAQDAGEAGAPDDANYLVTVAHADLSAEVVVGTSPGGELGGTWASPTVDGTHSGSSHAGIQSAAEATAAADATAKVATEAALARNADNLTSGTVADARIASTIARDSEVAAGYQPLDADLTALAAANNSAVLAATTASFLTADETKLDGIEAGAQVNPTTEVLQDLVGAMVTGGTETGIAVTYDDTNGRLDFVAEVTQAELDLKANDADVVHDTGTETIAGVKTFSSDPLIPDEAYGVGWNGSLEPPTKNAVYDKIETLSGGGIDPNVLDANTVLYATTDNTPAALAVAASRIVGRKATGDIVALTAAELVAIIQATLDGTYAPLPWLIDIDPYQAHGNTNWDTVISGDANRITAGCMESTGAQNAERYWDVVLAAGTWDVGAMFTTANNYGIITVQFDAVDKGTIDTYSAGVVKNVRSAVTGITVATSAKVRVKLKMATKNASSSSYYCDLQGLQLRRTA